MRTISQLNKNKSALSDIIAYVLLISITISLSVLVYNWLRFQFNSDEFDECPSGVDVVLRNYDCAAGQWLSIDLRNKGRFNVTGYIVRVHNRTGADFGIYILDGNGTAIAPGKEWEYRYNFSDAAYSEEIRNIGSITFLEVQPFIGKRLMCKSLSTQDIQCSS
jgi:hypothetical protein